MAFSLPRLGGTGRRLPAAAILLAFPATVAAQTFSGSGAGATPVFVLSSGPTTVSVEASDRAFVAFLLGTGGSVVAELTGTPQQEIRVPEDGRYLFEVRTSGVWRISVAGPDSMRALAIRGRIEGAQAAGNAPPAGWLARGLGAGLVLGPIGTALITQRAGRADPSLAEVVEQERLAGASATYAAAFREAYVDKLRSNRRTAALVGGITGTALLGFAILQLTVWDDGGEASGRPPPPTNVSIIPILSFPLQ